MDNAYWKHRPSTGEVTPGVRIRPKRFLIFRAKSNPPPENACRAQRGSFEGVTRERLS